MSLVGDYLTALKGEIQTAIDIEIEEGFFDGPVTDRDAGCIYVPHVREDHDTVREVIEARVRVFKVPDKQPEPEVPLSLLPLYEIHHTIQTKLSALPQGGPNLGNVWFCRLTEAEFNQHQYGVEMQFLAWVWNQWALVAPT